MSGAVGSNGTANTTLTKLMDRGGSLNVTMYVHDSPDGVWTSKEQAQGQELVFEPHPGAGDRGCGTNSTVEICAEMADSVYCESLGLLIECDDVERLRAGGGPGIDDDGTVPNFNEYRAFVKEFMDPPVAPAPARLFFGGMEALVLGMGTGFVGTLLPHPAFCMLDYMQTVSHQHYVEATNYPGYYLDFFDSLQWTVHA